MRVILNVIRIRLLIFSIFVPRVASVAVLATVKFTLSHLVCPYYSVVCRTDHYLKSINHVAGCHSPSSTFSTPPQSHAIHIQSTITSQPFKFPTPFASLFLVKPCFPQAAYSFRVHPSTLQLLVYYPMPPRLRNTLVSQASMGSLMDVDDL